MGQDVAASDPQAGPPRDLPASELADDDLQIHGRIGYGRFARFTPLGLALLLVGLLLAAGIARTGDGGGSVPGPKPSDLPGRPAPDVTIHLLASGDLRLADYRGSVVLLNFWATWCAPCQEEMPILQRLDAAGEVGGVPIEVVGVGSKVRDSDEDARAFIRALGVGYPVGRDAGGDQPHRGAIGQVFGQQDFLPMTVVIRPDGIVASVHYGPLTEEQLRALVLEAGQAAA